MPSHSRFLLALLCLLAGGGYRALAQSGTIGIGTTAPDASAALEIAASNKGLLIPRLTAAQRGGIGSPPAGLLVYQTDGVQPGFWYYEATGGWTWLNPTGADNLGSHLATQNLDLGAYQLTGNGGSSGLSINSSGNVGIGLTNPGSALAVNGGILTQTGGVGRGLLWYQDNGDDRYTLEAIGSSTRLALATNGFERLSVQTDGNVGIGTSTPAFPLHITSHSLPVLGIEGDATADVWTYYQQAGMLRAAFGYRNSSGGAALFVNGLDRLTALNNGNVGIGTITPLARLHVAGGVRVDGLVGSGTRMLTTDNLGNIAAQPLPADAQQLSISGSTISLTNGGSVTVPSSADNLGSHNATQRLNLGAQALVGTGSDIGSLVGIGVTAAGGLNMGQNPTSHNIFIGYQSGENTLSAFNQFFGYQSGKVNSLGSFNYFSGYQSGAANTDGSNNQFTGYRSGAANTSGYENHFSGYTAGVSNTTGIRNQFSGYNSGGATTTGSYNLFSGYQSGLANTTGSNNWAYGYQAGPTTGNLNNAGAIGHLAQVSQSNSIVLGGTGPNAVNVGIGTTAPAATLEVAGAGSSVRLGMLAGAGDRVVVAGPSGDLATVMKASLADNLGNHNATQPLLMNGNPVSFGTTLTQQLNLWNTDYALGVQPSTLLFRSGSAFAWYKGGSYVASQNIPGAGGSVQMLLTDNGSLALGIGASTPLARLHVGGGLRADGSVDVQPVPRTGSHPSGRALYVTGDFGEAAAGAEFRHTNGTQGVGIGYNSLYATGSNANQPLNLLPKGTGGVGVGTTTPRGYFDVAGPGDIYLAADPVAGTSQSLYLPGHLFLAPHAGSSISYLQARRADNSGTTALRLRTYNAGMLTEAMQIEGNGRVGIGTTAPQTKLHVAGDARIEALAGSGARVVTANAAGTLGTTPVAALADNLGNHTATQPLSLGANALTGTGASIGTAVGVGVRADGGLNIGQNTAGLNIFIGFESGVNTGSGSLNQFVGYHSGYSNTLGGQNQFFGYRSGYSNTTGGYNEFIGVFSGANNTTGSDNVFVGDASGSDNTIGRQNVFVGSFSGGGNNSGIGNTAIGFNARFSSATLTNATAIGYQALAGQSNSLVLGGTGSNAVNVGIGTTAPQARLHVVGGQMIDGAHTLEFGAGVSGKEVNAGKIGYQTFSADALDIVGAGPTSTSRKLRFFNEGGAGFTGSVGIGTTTPEALLHVAGDAQIDGRLALGANTTANNIFIGHGSGSRNPTGNGNQFVGFHSGFYTTTGESNLFEGYQSGAFNSTGSYNQFSGHRSGYSNTSGSYNAFSGSDSGPVNTTGSNNAFVGFLSAPTNTTGSSNVFVGYASAPVNTTGNRNTFVGMSSGDGNATGSNNTAIGYGARIDLPYLTNATALGYQAVVGQSNSMVLGGTGPDAVRVGIGTSFPLAKLDVQGGGFIGGYNFAFYAYNGVGAFTGTGGNASADISIRASNRIVAAEFNATSDRRLKHVVGLSDAAADLALLQRLRITDYRMRDRAQYGNRAFKKVIAQEVEEVFPQAVSQHTGFLPDIYAPVTAVEAVGDSLLCLTLPKALPAAQVGQRVRLIGPRAEAVGTVAQAGGTTLLVRGATQLRGEREVFVYGLEYPDVRTVDYEALSMLNVSATQELARQVDTLQQQLAAEQTARQQQTGQLREQLDQQQAALQTLQEQLARLLGQAPPATQARR